MSAGYMVDYKMRARYWHLLELIKSICFHHDVCRIFRYFIKIKPEFYAICLQLIGMPVERSNSWIVNSAQ